MGSVIPTSMQAVLLEGPGDRITVGQLPVPRPGRGQVLVRIAAAPINPSDLGFMRGSYGFQRPFPVTPGFEGSGLVVAAGPGLLPWMWLGKRVACAAAPSGGTWAEYLLAPAAACFPLARSVSWEQGAMLLVNPLTAVAFFDIAKREKHAAIVSNAAAGALGRMILRLGQTHDIPVIHVVRRQEQVELLRSMGGEYVLNSRHPDFDDQLRALCRRLRATLILDPVGGDQTQQLLAAAPDGSTALVYGSLSGRRIDTAAAAMGEGRNRVEGFFLPDWLAKRSSLRVLLDLRRVQRLVTNELRTSVQERFPLPAAQHALERYRANPTAGKVLLVADPERVRVESTPPPVASRSCA